MKSLIPLNKVCPEIHSNSWSEVRGQNVTLIFVQPRQLYPYTSGNTHTETTSEALATMAITLQLFGGCSGRLAFHLR